MFHPYAQYLHPTRGVARLSSRSPTRLLVTGERRMMERAQDAVTQFSGNHAVGGECDSAYRMRRHCDDASGGGRDNAMRRDYSRERLLRTPLVLLRIYYYGTMSATSCALILLCLLVNMRKKSNIYTRRNTHVRIHINFFEFPL